MFFCLKRQTTRCCCCKKAVSTIDRKINLGEECRLTSCKHVFEIGFEKLINCRTLSSERFHEIFISWHFLIHTILKLLFNNMLQVRLSWVRVEISFPYFQFFYDQEQRLDIGFCKLQNFLVLKSFQKLQEEPQQRNNGIRKWLGKVH